MSSAYTSATGHGVDQQDILGYARAARVGWIRLWLGLLLVCAGGAVAGRASTPAVTFGTASATVVPGESVTVPVTVSGFSLVTTAQCTLTWDTQVLALEGVDTSGSGLPASAPLTVANFGMTHTNVGQLTLSWDDPTEQGVTVADGTLLFTLKFQAVGANGTSSTVSFSDTPTPREVTVSLSDVQFISQNGTVQVVAHPLTVNGLTAQNKVYDGTSTATITGTPTISGVLSGDSVSLSGTATGTFADKTVGNNKPVTLGGLTLTGADAAKYALTQPNLTADITPATLTISGLTAADKGYDGTTAATLSGSATLVGVVSGDTVSLTGSATGAFGAKSVGNGKPVTVSGLSLIGADSANYTLHLPTLTANITAAPLTVTGLTAVNKVYDGTIAATLNGPADLAGVIGSDSVTLSGTPIGAFASKTVGNNKTVTVSGVSPTGADAGNYTLSPPSLTANITPVSLTVSGLTAANKAYDGNTTATITGTPALGGVIGNDAVSITGTATGAFTDSNAGNNKSVTVSGLSITGADAANYTLTEPALTANITGAPVTISGLSVANKVYDGTTVASLSGTASLSGVVAGDSVSLTGTATGAFANKSIGNGKSVIVSGLSLTGADAGKYVLEPLTLTANITPAPLSLSGIAALNKTYDGSIVATISGTATLGGVMGSDTVALTGTAAGAFATKIVGNNKPVTVSGLSLTGADAGNYTLSTPSLTANITPATLTVSGLTAANKPYDGTTTATLSGTATLVGVVATDAVSLTGTATGAFANSNAGNNKPVTVTGLSLTGADAGNYTLNLPTLTANITGAPVTVTGLTVANKVYDATTSATVNGTPTLSGVVAGDVVSLSGTATGTFANKAVGNNKSVTVSGLSLSGADAGKYVLSLPTLSANITMASLTVNGLTAADKVYDGTTVAPLSGTATLAGVLGSDTVTLTGTATGAFASETIGNNKPVTVSGLSLTGADAGNYTLSVPSFAANITPATLTVSGLTAANKAYDGTTTATINGTPTLVGVIGTDAVSLVGTATGSFADSNAGQNKVVTVTGLSITGADAPNYTLTQPSLTATITGAPLTVTGLTAANKVYDGFGTATISGTPSLSGVVAGETVTVTGTPVGTFSNKTVGSAKTVTVSGLSLSGADAGKYELEPVTLTANITPVTLTVSGLSASSKVYDGTTSDIITGTPTLSGVLGSDALLVTGTAIGTFDDQNVGNNKSVTVSGLSLTGADAGNYTLSLPTLTANITSSGVTFAVASTNVVPQGTLTLPVTVSGFSLVTSLQFTLTWDPSVLALTGVSDYGLPSFTGANFGMTHTNEGVLTVSWDDPTQQGVTEANATKIFDLQFQVVGPGGSSTTVAFGDQPTSREVTISLNAEGFVSQNASVHVAPAVLTVAGLSAASKVYDGTTGATLVGTPTLSGILGNDSVSLAGRATGTFANKRIGYNKPVTVTGLALTGPDAVHYTLQMPTLAADITPASLTVSGLTVAHKVYDGTTVATLSGTAKLVGAVAGDNITMQGAAVVAFADKAAGNHKPVLLSGLSLAGADMGNYVLNLPTLTADIMPAALTVSGLSAANKVYDTTTSVTFRGTPVLQGIISPDAVVLTGTVAGIFADKNAGLNKPIILGGLALAGPDAANYVLHLPALTATISPTAATVGGFTAKDKTYDGTTAATLIGTPTLSGILNGDSVSLSFTPTGNFLDARVGLNKTVIPTGLSLSGADKGNYTLAVNTMTATITPAPLTVSGLTAASKAYDGTTMATISGTAVLVGVKNSDTVSLTGTAVGTFADSAVGNNKPVSVSGLSLSGSDAANYTLTLPTLMANITTQTGFVLTLNASMGGSINASPAPNSDGGYSSGTVVTLQAVAASDYVFSSWSGDASGSANPITVTMNSSKSVTANFKAASAPAIALSANLDLGSVMVGRESHQTMIITNVGSAPLTVTNLTFPAGFSGDWAGGTIAPGNAQAVTVTFSPSAATNYSGSVTVNSDALSKSDTLQVSGIGTLTPIVDFNDDGQNDILWQHKDGWLAMWFMRGTNLLQAVNPVPDRVLDTNWSIVGTADFNGDGHADLLWQRRDGWMSVWYMNQTNLLQAVPLDPPQMPDPNWRIVATGDFNGDGHPDLLWQHTDGWLAVWYMNGIHLLKAVLLNPPQMDTNWKMVGTGDFNGDGQTDILWQHTNGSLAVWYMNGINLEQAVQLDPARLSDTSWKVVGTGDFNGDGQTDILWQRTDGYLAVWYMNGIHEQQALPLGPGQIGDPAWKIVGPK